MKYTLLLTFIVCFIVFSCGCTSISLHEEMNNTNIPATGITNLEQKLHFQQNVTANTIPLLSGEKWIKIDEIDNHHRGDSFNISGITNLDEGEELLIQVYFSSYKQGGPMAYDSSSYSGSEGVITVEKGNNQKENRWHFDVNTASSNWRSEQHNVDVGAIKTMNVSTAHSSFYLI